MIPEPHLTFPVTLPEGARPALRRFVNGEHGTDVERAGDHRIARAVLRDLLNAASRHLDPAVAGPFGAPARPAAAEPEAARPSWTSRESLVMARCGAHYQVPQLNDTEATGAECGACIQAAAAAATDQEWLAEIGRQWTQLTGKPWERCEGDTREAGLAANVANALFGLLAQQSAAAERSASWPLVLRFAEVMERKLEANRHKGNREAWIHDDPEALLKRLREETDELEVAMRVAVVRLREGLKSPRETSAALVKAARSCVQCEAADVANFALMIADWHDVRGIGT